MPRRLTQGLRLTRLHTGPALLIIDVLACLITWGVVGMDGRAMLLHALVTLAVCASAGLYRHRLSLHVLDDVPCLFGAVVVGHLAALTLDLARITERAYLPNLAASALLLAALVAGRRGASATVKWARCSGGVHDLALIIGAGHVGIHLACNLQQHAEYGVAPVGYIDVNPRVGQGEELPVPVLGNYDDLAAVIEDFNVLFVMVAFGAVREAELVDVLRTCDRLDVDVFLVPRLFELHNTARDTDDVWGIPLIRVRRAAFRSPWWKVKRLMDIVVSSVALIVLAPVLAACALAVRFEGGKGVIFRQQRVGLDGRAFEMLKFRSLKPADDVESQTQWTIHDDKRLGTVGRLLRSTSLDELPQLCNVLRGDMSLVGPRPERPHFVEQFKTRVPRYMARHRVPAGLTGWAQVHGLRGDTSIEDRARFDNYYIENWSLWLDVKILLRTMGHVLRPPG